jgi:hypothetical protein
MKQQQKATFVKFLGLTDVIIIVVGICIVAGLAGWQWQDRHAADIAIVHSKQAGVIQLALDEDRLHNIRGRLGNSQFEVSGGRLRFSDSPCRRRVCIHTGWLKESGEAAACLPNGISVVLHGDTPRYDSINF